MFNATASRILFALTELLAILGLGSGAVFALYGFIAGMPVGAIGGLYVAVAGLGLLIATYIGQAVTKIAETNTEILAKLSPPSPPTPSPPTPSPDP